MRIVAKKQETPDEDELEAEKPTGIVIDAGPYCLCRGPDDGTPMICCDKCNEWYHTSAQASASKFFDDNSDFIYDEEFTQISAISRSRERDQQKKRKEVPPLPPQVPKKPKTEDPVRKKVRESLTEALKQSKEAKDAAIPLNTVTSIANEIESVLFDMYKDTGKDYKTKFRSLVFNLKDPKNQQLRKRVVTGDLSPAELCKMSSEDLANEELANYRKNREEKLLDNIVIKKEHEHPLPLIPKATTASSEHELSVEHTSHIPVRSTSAEQPPSTEAFSSHSPIHESEDSSSGIIPQIEVGALEEKLLRSEPISIPSFNEFAEKNKDTTTTLNSPTIRDKPKSSADKIKQLTWTGYVKTTSNKFRVKGAHVSGKRIDKLLPETLNQVGRMELVALIKYLEQIPMSSSRQLSVVYFEPETETDSFEYVAAFEQLITSNRAAVLKTREFKESFLVPISADATIPSWAEGFQSSQSRSDKLLGAFIYSKDSTKTRTEKAKDKRKSSKPDVPTVGVDTQKNVSPVMPAVSTGFTNMPRVPLPNSIVGSNYVIPPNLSIPISAIPYYGVNAPLSNNRVVNPTVNPTLNPTLNPTYPNFQNVPFNFSYNMNMAVPNTSLPTTLQKDPRNIYPQPTYTPTNASQGTLQSSATNASTTATTNQGTIGNITPEFLAQLQQLSHVLGDKSNSVNSNTTSLRS